MRTHNHVANGTTTSLASARQGDRPHCRRVREARVL